MEIGWILNFIGVSLLIISWSESSINPYNSIIIRGCALGFFISGFIAQCKLNSGKE